MWVLFAEIWICLLIAFALGWFCHWFLLCRGKEEIPNVQEVENTGSTEKGNDK